jgi:hypothetical protein
MTLMVIVCISKKVKLQNLHHQYGVVVKFILNNN